MRCGLLRCNQDSSGDAQGRGTAGRHHRTRQCAFQPLRKWPKSYPASRQCCASGMFRHCPRPKRLFGATSLPGQGRLPILPRTGWRWTWRSPIAGQGIKFAPNHSQSGATDQVIACGRPATEMPHFDKYAYEDKACYGLSAGELGKDVPPDPHSTPLTKREIEAVVDYILATLVGK